MKNGDDLQVKAETLLQEWKAIDMKKATQLKFWGKQVQTARSKERVECNSTFAPSTAFQLECSADSEQFQVPTSDSRLSTSSSGTRVIVQEQLRSEIALIDADLVALYKRRAVGFLGENQEKELRLQIKKKKDFKQTLKNKVADQKRAKKARDDKKSKLAQICEKHRDIRMALKLRNNPRRPRIEVDQPMLLENHY